MHRFIEPIRLTKKWYLFVSLVLISVATSYLRLYIKPLSLTLTFESIPLLITGALFGPLAGVLNGAFVDIVTFPWGVHEFSIWFLLQPMSIGFFGGLYRTLKEWDRGALQKLLIGIVGFFSVLYGTIFISESYFLIAFGLVFWLIGRRSKDLALLVIFSLMIYVSSFGIGVLGSIFSGGVASHLLFFKVRAAKELFKLIVFLPFCSKVLHEISK